MGRILELNTEEAKKKALINERLSEEGKSLREEKERLRNDILGLTTQKKRLATKPKALQTLCKQPEATSSTSMHRK